MTEKGTAKKLSCLKTEPTWMKDRKGILGPLKISEVFLPGTHDSATYEENGKGMSIFSKFAVTQVNTIHGIINRRYFFASKLIVS